jgi:hypothetical protein
MIAEDACPNAHVFTSWLKLVILPPLTVIHTCKFDPHIGERLVAVPENVSRGVVRGIFPANSSIFFE